MEFKCNLCSYVSDSARSLATHIQNIHKMSTKEYTIKTIYNDIEPKCKECGKEVRYVAFTFKEYCKEHSYIAESNGGRIGGKLHGKMPPKKEEIKEEKKYCRLCKIIKDIKEFPLDKRGRYGVGTTCKECAIKYARDYRENNKGLIKEQRKKSLPKILKQLKHKYATDPIYRLKVIISVTIRDMLKRNKTSKRGKSILQYLGYTLQQLKEHLEKQFEPWMNWDNYGIPGGEEKKWQIDHIIPRSLLPYDNMEHPNFQKCWALENLRPLEAIENLKKGNKLV